MFLQTPKAAAAATSSTAASSHKSDKTSDTPIRALPCHAAHKCSYRYKARPVIATFVMTYDHRLKVRTSGHSGTGNVTNIESARNLSKDRKPEHDSLLAFTVDTRSGQTCMCRTHELTCALPFSPQSATADGKVLWSFKVPCC